MEELHMKKWKLAAAALCVCFLFTAAYAANAAPGGQADPLVTLSYLNGAYTRQVKDMVDQAVTARKGEMEQSLKNILAGQGGTAAPSGGSVFTLVTLNQGRSLVGNAGCEVMLRAGSAICGATDGVSLVDTTSGLTLGMGAPLSLNHLYMVADGPQWITATSASVEVLARGPYTIQ